MPRRATSETGPYQSPTARHSYGLVEIDILSLLSSSSLNATLIDEVLTMNETKRPMVTEEYQHNFDAFLFIDSMVALEGLPLAELPWADLGLGRRILLLVVPQVLQEVDKRKRDGRLAKRAREFRRLVGPAALTGEPTRIMDGDVQVMLTLASPSRVDWDALDDLDPQEGDARLVAQILHDRRVPHDRKTLISQDMLPIALASRRGLAVIRFPDEWIAPPEPSPHDKELTKLKTRVRELEASEPSPNATVHFSVGSPFTLPLVTPLSREEQAMFAAHLIRQNPRQAQPSLGFASNPLLYDTEYDGKYQTFVSATVPRYAANLHEYVQAYHSQVAIELAIANDGGVQAENLVVELRCVGGGLRGKFLTRGAFGPMPPRLENYVDRVLNSEPLFQPEDLRSPHVGRHEVVFEATPEGQGALQLHCADFRHGRRWVWSGIAHLDATFDKFAIEVTFTASNMKGRRVQSFELALAPRGAKVTDLIDPFARRYLVPFPLQDQFGAAVAERDTNWLDFSN